MEVCFHVVVLWLIFVQAQGCTNGYWNQTCDNKCAQECLSCSQADGSCTQCKNNTKYGPKCRLECSTTCKYSKCGIDGNCKYGCITNTFGKKCENKCDDHCSPKNNSTLCFEESGMCLYGCQTGYRGRFCHQVEAVVEQHPSSIEALGGGIGGGVVALAVIVNSEERSLHHLQFTSWPAKDVPDNVTSLIELRQRVNALPSTFNGPVIVHCRLDVKLCS
ncbi:PTPRC-like protein, partial [Mya arenaria]